MLGFVVLPLIAVVVRLAYSLALPDRIVITFEADPLTYDQIARNVVAGNGFSGASFYYPPGTDHLTAFWDPLYPYLLAALYWVFGRSVHIVRVAQALLGGGAVALTFALGRRLLGAPAGVIAAAISAVYPFFIYYAAQLLTETLFMALILAVFVAGYRAQDTARARWFAVLGVLTGLAALCRAEAFVFGGVLIIWLAWRTLRPLVARVQLGAIALVAMLVVMLPWGIRNQRTHGQFILTTTKLGYNLYKYYHPLMTADQTVPVVPFPDLDDLTEPQREAVMRRDGIQFMVADPGRTLWFMANKLALLFKLTPSNEVNRQYALVSVGSYGVLLPFMAAGLVLALRRRGDLLPVAAYVLFSVATKAAVFAGIRLRMQIEPFLILLAAGALVAAFQWVERRATWSGSALGSASAARA
jgi:4-amino-4-deoxy-L-arabinose transferase-like glycosyltransferase